MENKVLTKTLNQIEKEVLTIYRTPDGEEFNDFEEFYNYMTNEYKVSLRVSMCYCLDDALKYMKAEELFAGDDYDDIDEYMDIVDADWSDYNSKLEENTDVDVCYEWYEQPADSIYTITGTINGLLEFCEKQCNHYSLDDAGETLYREIDDLKSFKDNLAKLK